MSEEEDVVDMDLGSDEEVEETPEVPNAARSVAGRSPSLTRLLQERRRRQAANKAKLEEQNKLVRRNRVSRLFRLRAMSESECQGPRSGREAQ